MIAELILDYKPIISECFATDPELISTYHIEAGNGLDACVDRTFTDMHNASVEFFYIDPIGYFGVENDFLTGFFIKPAYRTSEVIKQFWKLVATKFAKTFYCGLYNKNIRAIDFILKSGGTEHIDLPQINAKFYILKRESLCQ